jgi:hypothetical protein
MGPMWKRHQFVVGAIGTGLVLTSVLFSSTGISGATGATGGNENHTEYWEGQGYGVCVKDDKAKTPFVVPAPPEGKYWTVLVLKAGSHQQGEASEVILDPVVGEAYSHGSGKDISHAILCKKEKQETTTTVEETTTTEATTTTVEETTTTEATTTTVEETTTTEATTTTVEETTTTAGDTTTTVPTEVEEVTTTRVITTVPDAPVVRPAALAFTGFNGGGLLAAGLGLLLIGIAVMSGAAHRRRED